MDLEDKVTAIPNKDEDLEALILHWAPTVTLVKDILIRAGSHTIITHRQQTRGTGQQHRARKHQETAAGTGGLRG